MFSIKDEPVLKYAFEDILNIVEMNEDILFLDDILKKLINKTNNIWHVNLFIELMIKNNIKMDETLKIVTPHFK